MLPKEPLLVMFLKLIDWIPMPPPPAKRKRGRQKRYSDRLIVKALIIMMVRRLYTAYSLLAFLEQETELTVALRPLLMEDGCFPSRRTWERRLAAIARPLIRPDRLFGPPSGPVACALGPRWPCGGVDSTPLRAKGGVWHKKDREAGVVPHSTIDTEAHWSKSGYHGWWYGWKLHLACTAAALWIPLAAELTPANQADNPVAPALIRELAPDVRSILGDTHYNDPDLRLLCEQEERCLVATQPGPYPHTDSGAPVRQLFHRLRSKAIEPFNSLFKNVFAWGGGASPGQRLVPHSLDCARRNLPVPTDPALSI